MSPVRVNMSRYHSYSHTTVLSLRKGLALGRVKAETWLMFLGSILLVLSIAYIVVSNMTAASTFKLNDQRKRIDELNLQNKKYETELANRESISRLEEEARRIGLVPIGRVKYIETPGDVAIK